MRWVARGAGLEWNRSGGGVDDVGVLRSLLCGVCWVGGWVRWEVMLVRWGEWLCGRERTCVAGYRVCGGGVSETCACVKKVFAWVGFDALVRVRVAVWRGGR